MNDSITNALFELKNTRLATITELESGISLSSEQFKLEIIKKITLLTAKNDLIKNSPVFILNSNSISFFINFLALFFLGIPAVPLADEISDNELQNMIEKIKPQLILSDSDIETCNAPQIFNFEASLVLFTSGTTNVPKGVVIEKSALLEKFKILSNEISLTHIKNTLCFIPTHFGHGLIGNSLWPIFSGDNFYISKKMNMDRFFKLPEWIEQHQITFFSTVPSHWEIILKMASDKRKLNSLQRVQSASAPLFHEKCLHILNWLPAHTSFYDVYGATEMLSWCAQRDVKNSNDNMHFNHFWKSETIQDNEGVLSLRSSCKFTGYLEDGQLIKHNTFSTGDIFNNGNLIGRIKNVINKNGIKIQLEDLNYEYMTSGLIKEAAAFPILDPLYGEKIGVFIVLKEGKTLDSFKIFCSKNLPGLRRPSIFLESHNIPTNDRGKVTVKILVEKFEKTKTL